MNNETTNSIPFTVAKGASEHPYLEMLRDGAQNCSIVPQEILDWSWLEPKDTSNAPTDELRQLHHFTISYLIKYTPQRKGKLCPIKMSKPVVKNKE